MHRLKTVCPATLLAILLFSLAHAVGALAGPLLELEEKSFDFGDVKEGSTLEHAFTILNKGDKVLQIDKVKPS